MVTRAVSGKGFRTAAVLLLGLFLAGCGGVEESVRGFAGGSSSKDKKEILSAIPKAQSASVADQSGAPMDVAVSGPAVITKNDDAVSVEAEIPAASVDAKNDDGSIRERVLVYRAGARRDPFASLITGESGEDDIVDLSLVTLVGIVEAQDGRFCVVEAGDGTSYVLRKGDRVRNGRVVEIRETSIVASQTVLGFTTTVQLELVDRKGEKHG